MMEIEALGRHKAVVVGATLATEADAIDVIGNCFGQGIDVVVLRAELLSDDFFWLSTGLAGAVLQKFQNYGFRVAIVGDISRFTAQSPALRDFVYESNKHGQTLFVSDMASLDARL